MGMTAAEEALRKGVLEQLDILRYTMERQGYLHPMAIAENCNGQTALMVFPDGPPRTEALIALCRSHQCSRLYVAGEMWKVRRAGLKEALKAVPSKCEDREEIIGVQAIDRHSSIVVCASLTIDRRGDGSPFFPREPELLFSPKGAFFGSMPTHEQLWGDEKVHSIPKARVN
jgi:hypothetical protein